MQTIATTPSTDKVSSALTRRVARRGWNLTCRMGGEEDITFIYVKICHQVNSIFKEESIAYQRKQIQSKLCKRSGEKCSSFDGYQVSRLIMNHLIPVHTSAVKIEYKQFWENPYCEYQYTIQMRLDIKKEFKTFEAFYQMYRLDQTSSPIYIYIYIHSNREGYVK